MARSRILVDSNAYFRLAKSIQPLLGQQFGVACYSLCVLKELDAEYFQSSKLQTKFSWVEDREFRLNRANNRLGPGRHRQDVSIAIGVLKAYCRSNAVSLSSVDISYLAHGFVLDMPIVSDDEPMLEVAKEHAVPTMHTVELLALMLECRHIDIAKVRSIAKYLRYERDLPRTFTAMYKGLFGEPFPK